MNEIIMNNVILPDVSSCDYLAAQESFFHADRIADFHVMIYVTDGCIPVTEDKIDYEIHPGDLFFLKSGIRHFGKTEVVKGTRWYYVHFYLDFPSLPEGNDRPQPRSLTLPKMLTNLSESPLERRITAFTEYWHTEDPRCVWNRNQQFFHLLTEIAYYRQEDHKPLRLSDNIAQYLAGHYNQPFSAKELEKQFYLSYKYMAEVFKKEKNMTMQQFHTSVRMETACRLLRSTLLPVGEISRQVGYTDMLYFSRCFHTVMGMSPTEYRKLPRDY